MTVKGVLFDMDGVIADTAKFHYIAWKNAAKTLGIDITESFNEQLKGVSRAKSLDRILEFGGITLSQERKDELMANKNSEYVELLDTLTSDDILPGILELLKTLNSNGIKVSVASISRNAPLIIEKLEIAQYIDAVANPNHVKESKPAPDIFIEAARLINIPAEHCVGIEDAEAGIESIRRAGVRAIGIGVSGDISLPNTAELTFPLVQSALNP